MEVQAPAVGVQHAHRAGCGAQLGVVVAEGVERVPGALHQQRIDPALVAPGQAAQLGRQREGDHEVGGRHQRLKLALQPDLCFVVLAVRAGAVAAGVGHAALLAAARALRQHAWRKAGAAALHCRQRLVLAGQKAVFVAPQQVWLEALDELGQRDHSTLPQPRVKLLISALMHSPLCWAVWLVRWV